MIVSALIGNPTDHSVSPTLFSLYATSHNLEYAHVKFNIQSNNLKRVIRDIPAFGFTGVNVTLPFKTDVIRFLDKLSPEIKQIGAVNTIVNKNGCLIGYNTDLFGAIKTIENSLGRKVGRSDKVIVFGAGGAARAIVSGVINRKASVTVLYRTPKSAKTVKFIRDFNNLVKFSDNNEEDLFKSLIPATIICNATSAGMYPEVNESPISFTQLKSVANQAAIRKKLFFDVIFNPGKTKFLKNAERFGATIVGGIDMMIYQGVKAFYLWTGKKVNNSTIQKAKTILRKLLS
jgi:shikimate dehydrogenase